MSDFLTNLAARAIAQPTLRPRVRSRFEPEETFEPDQPSTARPRTMSTRTVIPSEVEGSGRVGRAADAIAPPAQPDPSTPLGMTEVSPPRVIREVARDVPVPDVQRIVETRDREVRVPRPAEIERVVETREVERPQHRYVTQPPRVITRREAQLVRHERETQTTTTIDRTNNRVETIREEPVVHVSIGRVEVRAIAQPQQQKSQQRGAPKMTIDDYVARRKAKERR